MLFSATRLPLLLTVSLLAAPVFAQQKGFTVTWVVTIKQPAEVKDKNGKVSHISPDRTYKATEILEPLKEGEIPPGELDKMSKIKDPMAFANMMKTWKAAKAVTSQTNKPVITYAFNDSFIESIPFKGEGGVLTVDGQEGTIVGSGKSTHAGAGNGVTTLGYVGARREYHLWLPFYMVYNGQPVDKTYYNYSINGKGEKEVKQPPAFKNMVDPMISATLRSPNKDEKIWPVFKLTGPMPLKINQTIKGVFLMPSNSVVPVPVDIVVNAVVTPIK